MRVIAIALKDLLQLLRDKFVPVFLVVMPLVFTVFMGFAYRGAVTPEDPRAVVGWDNADAGAPVSEELYSLLAASDTVRLEIADAERIERDTRSGKLAAGIVIPQDYSALMLAGAAAQITLVADEASVTGQSAMELIRPAVTRLASAVEIARLHVSELALEPAAANEELLAAFHTAMAAWQADAASERVAVEAASAIPEKEAPLGGNPYNQTSPGILVQFAVMGLVGAASFLVEERKLGTLQRLLSTSLRSGQVIAGHFLAMFVQIFAQCLLLIIFGQLVLGVDYFRTPLGTIAVTLALSLWVACLGLLIGVLAKSDDQAVLFSVVAMMVFSSLGGAWFPLEGTGKVYALIGHLTPAAWAMDGYQNIVIRQLGFSATLLPAGIQLLWAVGLFGLAMWQFRAASKR